MPLVSALPLLQEARARRYCVGAFNVDNLPLFGAVVRAAEGEQAPVIVQVGSAALDDVGLDEAGALVKVMAGKATVPVALHLDHGHTLAELESCIKAGFTSLMIDGSSLPYEENIRLTKAATDLCHAHGLPLEGELGAIPGLEEGRLVRDEEAGLTDPDQAADFVRRTGCDMLAISVGNVHYMSTRMIQLDFDRIAAIREKVPVPLVLHGGAAVTDDDMRRAVACGICKYNIAYRVQKRFLAGLAAALSDMDEEVMPGRLVVYPKAIIARGVTEAQAQVQQMIGVLGGSGRAEV